MAVAVSAVATTAPDAAASSPDSDDAGRERGWWRDQTSCPATELPAAARTGDRPGEALAADRRVEARSSGPATSGGQEQRTAATGQGGCVARRRSDDGHGGCAAARMWANGALEWLGVASGGRSAGAAARRTAAW
ncbi:hypothetical protein Scep_000248 [Stephania cephalantha]|uniref:Uncharacterized protein n=1 Tax=Stephania cephalantha TaxID=152367 RepID=A0AAP0L5P9_9MAGN